MTALNITKLNEDITKFQQVYPITDDMKLTFESVSRLIMLDRYAFKDTAKTTLSVGDIVVLTVKTDPKFPARGVGHITAIADGKVTVKLEEQYAEHADTDEGTITRPITAIDKPLELYYEQIAKRNAHGLSAKEADDVRGKVESEFYEILASLDFIPGGRVIYGAGSETDVTFFNCYVMPYPKDSREGIGEHRNEVMEIMSRGGGVGTNGSTLRPRNALARGVNGKSSGSVSWLNDIAELTHLVEQGGSRRGAQMIMMADWHPDIVDFVISKMQNPKVLRFIIETTQDEQIRELAQQKLKFTPLTEVERELFEAADAYYFEKGYPELTSSEYKAKDEGERLLKEGGRYSVHNPEFLTGANISVAITKDFMTAIEADADYELRFPDVENYDEYDMHLYNERWHEVGDVREWANDGYAIKTYRTIKAKELWNLINVCATYSAEPGIFFIDNANDATNAKAYGQSVVATNPLVNVSGRI